MTATILRDRHGLRWRVAVVDGRRVSVAVEGAP